jgi:formylglycine-generating enzyme required for sulfatase activity
MTTRNEWVRWAALAAIAVASTAVVAVRARRDAADPARCGGLLAAGTRCCAAGQSALGDRCVGTPEHCPAGLELSAEGCAAPPRQVAIAGGLLRAGAGDWEAEGRITAHDAMIAPFRLDVFEATERAYAECVAAERCAAIALSGEPGRAVSRLTRDEAAAYCAFRGGRLPSGDEWTFAAGGPKARRYPWGDTGAVCRRAVWGIVGGPCGLGSSGPELAGAHPDGASPDGVQDLAGNVAEWVAGDSAVRGGSFVTSLATDLRTWQMRAMPPSTRSVEVGVRCAYDASP